MADKKPSSKSPEAPRDEYVAPERIQRRSGFFDFIPAVREGRQQSFENALAQRALELQERTQFNNERQGVVQGKLETAQGQRQQEEFDTERQSRVTQSALGAFANMVDTIAGSDIAEADRPQAYAAAFDRIAPALQASGYDPQAVDSLRANLIENPSSAADILAGIQGSGGGSQASLQAGVTADGRSVFVNPRTGRETARGISPGSLVVANQRAEIAQQNANTAAGNLGQRTLANDPTSVFNKSAARAEGAAAGVATQTLPAARAAIARSVDTIDRLSSTDPQVLQSVLGVPSLSGVFRGGAGSFGAIPGTPGADAASDIEQTVSQARLAAYESLRGGGHITEAESLFGAQAWANLTRARSLSAFQSEMTRFRENLTRADEILQQRAAPSQNPNRARASAPAAASIDVDSYLQSLGH